MSGRSPDATQIHTQFLDYHAQLNSVIGKLDILHHDQRLKTQAQAAKQKIIQLQTDLHQAYRAHHDSNEATLDGFKIAFIGIDKAVQAAYAKVCGKEDKQEVDESDEALNIREKQLSDQIRAIVANEKAQPVEHAPISKKDPHIEHGTWYIDWTRWDFPVPEGVDTVNIFVGNMRLNEKKEPVIDGFDCMCTNRQTNAQDFSIMTNFAARCHAKGIDVKISIGGGGGRYDHCWDILTEENVKSVAQALATFCTKHSIDGVDFDYEGTTSSKSGPEQQKLVGKLIYEFKALNPKFQTSLCTNAGFGPKYPWQPIVETIVDAACVKEEGKGKCALDRLYIMSYYDPIEKEKMWVEGWAGMLQDKYNFNPSQITVGLNNTDAHAYDIAEFAAWAKSKGFSTCYWCWDPARKEDADKSALIVQKAYKEAT